MSILDDISESLSNFPRDIIIQWVAYYAETEGWPPPNPLSGRWKKLLGDDQGVSDDQRSRGQST